VNPSRDHPGFKTQNPIIRYPRPNRWSIRQRSYPCPACDKLLTDDGRQALKMYGLHRKAGVPVKAYFRCRVCGHRFSMRIDGVG